jgi:hypothetical protein
MSANTLKNRLFTIWQVNGLVKYFHSLHVLKSCRVPATAACSMIQVFNENDDASNTQCNGCNNDHVPNRH